MRLTWDENKRQMTRELRGLDFAEVGSTFQGIHITDHDTRFEYGEDRFITTGYLKQRLCVVVWTPRQECRHIISLRKANDREKARFENRRLGSGHSS
jgi:uncharacterized protein